MSNSISQPHSKMPTTEWSLLARLKDVDATKARAALEELCQAYHYPLYCQIRRRGLAHHDAEDALHEFLIKLLRHDTFGIADADKGRLRTFLISALQRFLANWRRDQHRQKTREISREAIAAIAQAEDRFVHDTAAHQESPDLLYDRQWAQELMNRVLNGLHADYSAKGREKLFEVLKPVLVAGGTLSGHDSEALAASIGLRPGALRTALHRLLQDYRERLRLEILQTVDDKEMAKAEFAELRQLFKAR